MVRLCANDGRRCCTPEVGSFEDLGNDLEKCPSGSMACQHVSTWQSRDQVALAFVHVSFSCAFRPNKSDACLKVSKLHESLQRRSHVELKLRLATKVSQDCRGFKPPFGLATLKHGPKTGKMVRRDSKWQSYGMGTFRPLRLYAVHARTIVNRA